MKGENAIQVIMTSIELSAYYMSFKTILFERLKAYIRYPIANEYLNHIEKLVENNCDFLVINTNPLKLSL